MSNDKAQIIARLDELEKEKTSLLAELALLHETTSPVSFIGKGASDTTPENSTDKIKLFLSMFATRTDVYPRLWENKKGIKGYSPVCKNEWVRGTCNKPRIKCHECSSQAFAQLDETVIEDHLLGNHTIGVYSIDRNDNCLFLAADFDGDSWKDDSLVYAQAAKLFGIQVAIEISRSGNGAHAWIFFQSPVPASSARILGFLILEKSQKNSGAMNLESYDRFFPNQDLLPEGGFGNLIALPLQKKRREAQCTEFIDGQSKPYQDQWKYLSSVKRISETEIQAILQQHEIVTFDQERNDMPVLFDKEHLGTILEGKHLSIRYNSGIRINRNDLSPRVEYALRQLATFANPKFFQLQNMRYPTWGTPRFITLAEEDRGELVLPRGILDQVIDLLKITKADVTVSDERPRFNGFDVTFTGTLDETQQTAVQQMMRFDCGLLTAPPGGGKTVMACAIIAQRKVPTLILVHRDQLVTQWSEQLEKFLGIKKNQIGVLGGTRKKLKGMIDIAMLQSISKNDNAAEILSAYEYLIIDECHHIPAVSFETTLRKANVRYITGLTATPYRKDGLQPIIIMHCGPVRHEITASKTSEIERRVVVRATSFHVDADHGDRPPLHILWEALVNDESRLLRIAEDISSVLAASGIPVILSDRKDHLSRLLQKVQLISPQSHGFLITGEMGKKARKDVLEKINAHILQNEPVYLLSTGSLLGEGFDIPACDTLFITMPVSFKGRVIQYAGRIHRIHAGKERTVIYDYVDTSSGVTLSMFKKRLSAYREMGYEIEVPDNETIRRMMR